MNWMKLIAVSALLSAQPALAPGEELTAPAFAEGERLVYLIRWGMVHGGYATLEIDRSQEVRGRSCYVILSQARSNDFFDVFYKVRDRNISYIDREGLYSHGFEKHVREGNYSTDKIVEFLYDENRVVFRRADNTVHKENTEIKKYLQDTLSALYYMRTLEIAKGGKYIMDVSTGDKMWPLEVEVLREDDVEVDAGKFSCFVVEPKLKGEGIFVSKGRLFVWVTKDARHMPVLLKSKIPVGYITGELVGEGSDKLREVFK